MSYYFKYSFINRFLDRFFDKFKESFLRRRYVAKRFKALEYARQHGAEAYSEKYKGQSIGSWSTRSEDNYRTAAWEYSGRVLITVIVIVAIAVPVALKIYNDHQRSLASAALWSAVKDNNKQADVVSPAGIVATMPCKVTKQNDNNSDFTGATYSCTYVGTSYSTNNLATSEIRLGADGNTNDLVLTLGNDGMITYTFEVDTMKNGVSPTPYLVDCVSSSQDQNNASDNPGEVMSVAFNGSAAAPALGSGAVFNVCEWTGNEGTANATAETVVGNTIVQLSILTTTNEEKGLLNSLEAYMGTVGY